MLSEKIFNSISCSNDRHVRTHKPYRLSAVGHVTPSWDVFRMPCAFAAYMYPYTLLVSIQKGKKKPGWEAKDLHARN